MKPAPFTWHGPRSAAEAVDLLGEHGADAKVLAGGQSLVPLLAMRLAEPHRIVDINQVAELDFVRTDAGGVTVGALARHARVDRDPAAGTRQPLLHQALRLVAHPTIRNRGTTVGSLAHADPAAELTAVLALTAGTVTARSVRGDRTVGAADFFVGALESALEPDELAVHAHFPALPERSGSAFVEVSRRAGDYALCGVGAIATVEADGTVGRLRCGYLAVGETPLVLDLTDAWADGPDQAAATARASVEPGDDLHATAAYRRHLAGVLTVRAARQAIAAAGTAVAA